MTLQPILEDVAKSIDAGIWYPAIATCLAVPDICGAIDSPELPNGRRYVRWYDENVLPLFGAAGMIRFDGEVARRFRNSLIHQATPFDKNIFGYDRVAFSASRNSQITVDFALSDNAAGQGETMLMVSGLGFFKAIGRAVARWERTIREDNDSARRERLWKAVKLHPQGIFPHIGGLPLVG